LIYAGSPDIRSLASRSRIGGSFIDAEYNQVMPNHNLNSSILQ
jgi:hypothetical protein